MGKKTKGAKKNAAVDGGSPLKVAMAPASPHEAAPASPTKTTDSAGDMEGDVQAERWRASQKIEQCLETRPGAEDLEKKNVLTSHVAPQIQGVQKQLQRKMNADELSHRLEGRPDVQELRDHAIVHGGEGVAPSLQAAQEKLQMNMNADKVQQHLKKRPSIEELRSYGVLDKTDTDMAASLTATAKKLERNLIQDQVSHLLESRPEKESILESGDAAVAPVLQGAKHQLEHQLKADEIARQLRGRSSVSELEEKGIIDGKRTTVGCIVPPEGELGKDHPTMKRSLSQRERYALALKAASRIAADKLISTEEKARLKDLILSDNEKVVAALECYELDEDIEEMLDTLYRVAKMST